MEKVRQVKRSKQKLASAGAMAEFIFDFPGIINQKMASIKLDMELICKIDAIVTVSMPGTSIITLNHECNHSLHSNCKNPIDSCSEATGSSTPDTLSSQKILPLLSYSHQIRQSTFNSSLIRCHTSTYLVEGRGLPVDPPKRQDGKRKRRSQKVRENKIQVLSDPIIGSLMHN